MRYNKILVGLTATAAVFLTGCTLEPYVIPREEQYARDFIKTFGLIAPGHDWTAAQQADVTVNTAAPTTVKVYADYNGETYLFGKYEVEAGSTPLNFDIPKGATNYTLKANGRKITFTPGQTVDLGTASRSINTAGGPGVTIKLLPDEREDGGVNYLSIVPKDILKFTEVLEENEDPCRTPEETNLIIQQKAITENFVAKAKSFWIFPECWDTNNWCNNTIGIYYYAQEGATGAEKIVDINGNEEWVIKVPIYVPVPRESDDESQKVSIVDNLFTVTGTIVTLTNSWPTYYEKVFDYLMIQHGKGLLPDGWELAIADGTDNYKDQNNNKFESGAKLLRRSADEKFFNFLYVTNSIKDEESAKIIYNATYKVYPKFNTEFHYTPDYWYITGVDPSTFIEEVVYHQQPKYLSPTFFKSKGIVITFNKEETFGFYIERGGTTKFSEAKYNESLYHNGKFVTQACYVCTFTQGTDTYGNTLRRLCFEDWFSNATLNEDGTPGSDSFGDMTNFDMNDMVFRVYGFDYMDEHPDITPGEIDDPQEEDMPFPWIIACEDLGGTDDYDFNDVVFGVEHVAGEREVYVTALAAGGTLETHLYYGDQPIIGGPKKTDGYEDEVFGQYTADGSGNQFSEWHQWLGSNYVTSMINTKSFKDPGATVVLVLKKSEVDNFTMSNTTKPSESIKNNSLGGFRLTVKQSDGDVSEIKAPLVNEGGIITDNIFPQMFASTVDYKWPTERTPIYSTHIGDTKQGKLRDITINGKTYAVYPNSFHDWVQKGGSGFHSQEPTGAVINHGWKGFLKKSQIN